MFKKHRSQGELLPCNTVYLPHQTCNITNILCYRLTKKI